MQYSVPPDLPLASLHTAKYCNSIGVVAVAAVGAVASVLLSGTHMPLSTIKPVLHAVAVQLHVPSERLNTRPAVRLPYVHGSPTRFLSVKLRMRGFSAGHWSGSTTGVSDPATGRIGDASSESMISGAVSDSDGVDTMESSVLTDVGVWSTHSLLIHLWCGCDSHSAILRANIAVSTHLVYSDCWTDRSYGIVRFDVSAKSSVIGYSEFIWSMYSRNCSIQSVSVIVFTNSMC